MALFDNLIAKANPGDARQPQAGVAVAPRTSVAPPAAAAAPVGRPPSQPPSFPGGVGAPLPLTGGAAAPTTTAPTPQGTSSTTRPGGRPPAPTKPLPSGPAPAERGGATPPATSAPGAPAQGAEMAGAVPGGYSVSLDHVPTAAEMVDFPQGVAIQTPYGTIDRTTGALQLSPEGKQAYQEAVVRQRTRFGPHPFANDPTAEPIPVTLGKPMFNAFTGQWVDRPAGWGTMRRRA